MNDVLDRTTERSKKQFVLIFRQRPGELSAEDLERRTAETRVWADTHDAAGHALDPRILGAENEHLAPEPPRGAPGTVDELPITATLFVEACNLADAVAVARDHPGRRFGASIEVRPWAPPPSRRATAR